MAISGLFTELLKNAFHRHRPRESYSAEIWDGPGLSKEYKSFPSGHSTSVAAMATVVAFEYRDTPAIGAIAYTIAAATGWSRMNDNAHWASDVFTGFVIGYCCSRAVVSSRAGWKLSVQPASGGRGGAARLSGTW
jgi:membrane-associated phospholipid phosphatase